MPIIWFWVLVFLLFVMILAFPVWPYSGRWGYGASGGALAAVIAILLLFWFGWLVVWWPWSNGYY